LATRSDPCCGTGGFLAIAYEHIARNLGQSPASTDIDTLKHETFFGREKENLVFPIALANLVLHGIDQPNLWHGNTLTKRATYSALFDKAPKFFDVILTNPPFGGKEGKDAQKNYAYATGSTQVLFVQDILGELASDGRCAIVLDDGFLFRKDEDAFVETKRKLVDECDLWAIISLPGGCFSGAGATVKTNLLFFTKGKKTTKIWYYDLTHVKVGKKSPMTLSQGKVQGPQVSQSEGQENQIAGNENRRTGESRPRRPVQGQCDRLRRLRPQSSEPERRGKSRHAHAGRSHRKHRRAGNDRGVWLAGASRTHLNALTNRRKCRALIRSRIYALILQQARGIRRGSQIYRESGLGGRPEARRRKLRLFDWFFMSFFCPLSMVTFQPVRHVGPLLVMQDGLDKRQITTKHIETQWLRPSLPRCK